ncbi:glycine betaine ABC transporter substrate-binding protein [Cupriavidus sp. L7L]|uniref:glycine betaine ABC transporter substrate-binding protein n=1 Tax=Cupriavidus sp. L7L TaxID=2546443 RepID=UPI0010557C39|nr:glycine betaine ABC transporter substrate-binding protein [Cupriavidus sp. L7L]TDF62668.1 histidine ABC transporter substrate-binding protein [Cupriavidus sp. L7L]
MEGKVKKAAKIAVAATSLLFAHAALASDSSWCESGRPIKFAEIGWDSGKFFTELMREIIEKGYGCKTEAVVGSSPITQAALLNNDLQVFVEYWQGRTESFERAAERGSIQLVGSLVKGGGREGWFVPEYVIHGDPVRGIKPIAPNLKSVSDLARYAEVFRDDEDPTKGRFYNCPTGWACEKDNNQRLKAYKLTASYNNFRPGTGAAFDAAIASAFQRGKPILFTYWGPSNILGKYKSVQLQEPEFNSACWKTIHENPSSNPCGSASPATNLTTALSRDFAKGSPAIVGLMQNVSVPMEDINRVIAEMADKKIPPRAAARTYINENKKTVEQWLSPEAKKALYGAR